MNKIRKIHKNDINNGVTKLLNQLSPTNKIDKNEFENFVKNLNDNHQIWVIERNKKIIAMGTILIEKKIIHDMGLVAHIEDIVVDKESRGQKLGKTIINLLIEIAKDKNCYKVILNCKDELIPFYKKLNFEKKSNQMAVYF